MSLGNAADDEFWVVDSGVADGRGHETIGP